MSIPVVSEAAVNVGAMQTVDRNSSVQVEHHHGNLEKLFFNAYGRTAKSSGIAGSGVAT